MNSGGMPGRKSFLPSTRLSPVFIRLFCCGLLFVGANGNAQSLEETQQQFLHGHYSEVIATAQKKAADGDYRGDWRMLLVKSLLTVGRYAEAFTNANEGVSDVPGSISMRLLARETALYQNNPEGANRQLAEISALLQRRPPAYQDGT